MSLMKPDTWTISELIGNIEQGDIKLPAFQRGFIWEPWQILDLLDSIYRDYPIGSLLFWYSKERLKSTRNICGFSLPDKESEHLHYVLDGQQRLSTIYGVFSTINHKPDIFEIYFNLITHCFLTKDDMPIRPQKATNLNLFDKRSDDSDNYPYLKLDAIFDISRFFKAKEEYKFTDAQIKAAEQLIEQFQSYRIPIILVKDRSKEDIGIIFQRINSKGTELNPLDLANAWTWSEDFHLGEQIGELKELIGDKGFEDIDVKIILQCLSAIINGKTNIKYIIAPDPKDVRKNINNLRKGLERAIDFLSTQFNVLSSDFLPHSHQIVSLTYFFSQVTRPNPQQTKALTQWFWRTAFSRRYAGDTDEKMNEDILFFQKVLNNDFTGIDSYTIAVNKDILTRLELNKSHPYTRSYSLLLAQKRPLDLLYGNVIDLGRPLSTYNVKELHHIFPKDFLKNKGFTSSEANSLCNICFLPSEPNKKISNKPPSIYLFGNVGLFSNPTLSEKQLTDVLESNLMPTDLELYQNDSYNIFIDRRADIILEFLAKLIQL